MRAALPWGLWFAALVMLASGLYELSAARAHHIDYSPGIVPWSATIGPAGAKTWNYGTVLNTVDANNQWNAWTGTSKLTNQSPATGCGSTSRCIIYRNDQGSITINGQTCTLPPLSWNTYAKTYVSTPAVNHLASYGCPAFGTNQVPVFIISYNNDGPSVAQSSSGKIHIARHEMGHALRLWDTGVSCWTEYELWYPLMKNGPSDCTAYPDNWYATPNEIGAVKSENSW